MPIKAFVPFPQSPFPKTYNLSDFRPVELTTRGKPKLSRVGTLRNQCNA